MRGAGEKTNYSKDDEIKPQTLWSKGKCGYPACLSGNLFFQHRESGFLFLIEKCSMTPGNHNFDLTTLRPTLALALYFRGKMK